MKTIYKYPIDPTLEKIELAVPGGGEVLAADLDPRGDICVWILVDTEKKDKKVNIYCLGTGMPMDWIQEDILFFIGTVKDGLYMWHIFKGETK